MTVVVEPGLYRAAVLRDLTRLLPPNTWSIDTYGFLTVKPSARPTPAENLLTAIAKAPGLVQISGSEAAMSVGVAGQLKTLGDVGGAVFSNPAAQGPDTEVAVLYDSSNNYGVGYWGLGLDDARIDLPTHIMLGHELGHARQLLEGTWTSLADGEVYAIGIENDLRGGDAPPLPIRKGHSGGKKEKPKQAPVENPPRTSDGCFVATAAYGSPMHPVVGGLREFRERVLRPTREGRDFFAEFHDVYAAVSAPVVRRMAEDEATRDLVRDTLVSPIVRYLAMACAFPDLPLQSAGPWAPFLEGLRDDLEDFASIMPLPSRLGEIAPDRAADELIVALRYQLRDPGRRRAWLEGLRRAGELPLPADGDIAERLRSSGRSEDEIALILEPVGAACLGCAFGNDVGTAAEGVRWRYTVTVRNATTNETYLNLRIFYLAAPGTIDNMGLVTLPDLAPGEIAVFPLCECSRLESYYIEGDLVTTDGTTGSFVVPNDGSITPGSAGDPNPCEDSWAF